MFEDWDPQPQRLSRRERRRAVQERVRQREGRGGRDNAWNLLTLFTWLGTVGIAILFVTLFSNPYTPLNPFQPPLPTVATAILLPTSTTEPTATITPLITEPPATATTQPTATAEPLPAETAAPAASPSPTIESAYPFIVRNAPAIISSRAIPNHEECHLWLAGQTYDLQQAPMVGITVMLGGSLQGATVYQLALTGTSLQFGQAGYEFYIADSPVETEGTLWVQLFDQSMIPLSARVYFDTYADCNNNLILINFRQVR